MNRYLLLRDNKQTGPYTVPELIEKGIKAYDLVWLDGKSAAWRYPSEIEELKAYAPIVEEQPFDRFYKKPVAEKHYSELAMMSQVESDSRNKSIPVVVSITRNELTVTNSLIADPGYISGLSSSPVTGSGRVPEHSANTGNSVTGVTEQTFTTISPEPVHRDVSTSHEEPRKIYVTLPGSKATPRANNESVRSSIPAPHAETIVVRPAAAAREEYRDEQVNPARSDAGQIERYAPAAKYKKVESDYSPEDKTEHKPDHRSEYKPEYKADYRPEYKSEYKPEYKADYKSEYKPEYKADYKPEYKSEYKKSELADSSFSRKFAGADLLTDTVFPVKTRKSILAGKQNTVFMSIGALCLLLGGIIIGLAISNSKKESARELDLLVKQIQERERLKQLPPSRPVAKTETPATINSQTSLSVNDEPVVVDKPKTNAKFPTKLAVSSSVTKIDKKTEEPVTQTAVPDKQPVSIQPAVQESKVQANAAAESTRKNIRQLVSVKSNKYKTGVIGGISELSLTVFNKSEFEIDQVEVEVAYLGPEKRVIKTQTIVFNNIKPGNQLTQDVPRTNRGVSVTTSIKVINSKSLGLASSGT